MTYQFINDLPSAAQHIFINLFADDTSMYRGNEDMEDLEILLQNDITNISRWFYENKLSVNTKKTCNKFESRHKVNTSPDFRLHINDIMLDQVDTASYLHCRLYPCPIFAMGCSY